MRYIPEHPQIRNALLTGYPDGRTHDAPECPVCRQEAEYFVLNAITKEIMGCDNCTFREDAWEWAQEQRDL